MSNEIESGISLLLKIILLNSQIFPKTPIFLKLPFMFYLLDDVTSIVQGRKFYCKNSITEFRIHPLYYTIQHILYNIIASLPPPPSFTLSGGFCYAIIIHNEYVMYFGPLHPQHSPFSFLNI
jgi:hypothetical protein